jgi:hypothetical protein
MTKRKCLTCLWWDVRRSSYGAYEPMTEGLCRKNTPSTHNGTGRWPTTDERDWCGEHTPKGDA